MFNHIKSKIVTLYQFITARAEDIGYPYKIFGVFGVIAYPLYYIIWIYFDPQGYENLIIRAIATLLSLFLIFKDRWPVRLRRHWPIYWYFTMLYCLPFFFTFMLLKNNLSYGWVLNTLTGVVLAILLLDIAALIVILPIGVLLGWFLFHFTTPSPYFIGNYRTIIITYSAVIIFGAMFSRSRELRQREKLQTMRSIATSMAHELRTPLRAISLGVGSIEKYLPNLLDAYQKAKDAKLDVAFIEPTTQKLLQGTIQDVESETQASFNVIDMLLINASLTHIDTSKFELCSILNCVDESLRRYAFDIGQKELVHWDNSQDFIFFGDKLFMTHILFNLLKNAIYYIRDAGKGHINIWCKKAKQANYLYFKDTGKGITKKNLPHIFDQFFTCTRHGSGVGLTFCKTVMHSFGGDIQCQSEVGEYTLFILSFPPVPQSSKERI